MREEEGVSQCFVFFGCIMLFFFREALIGMRFLIRELLRNDSQVNWRSSCSERYWRCGCKSRLRKYRIYIYIRIGWVFDAWTKLFFFL